MGSLLGWVVVTAFAPFFLQSPDDKTNCYIFGCFWGILFGWYYPTQSTVFIELIPRRQEAEMMGLFTFCSQILTWLPPLVFSALNEAGFSMKFGLYILVAFFVIALSICFFVVRPNYEAAVRLVSEMELSSVDVVVGDGESEIELKAMKQNKQKFGDVFTILSQEEEEGDDDGMQRYNDEAAVVVKVSQTSALV